MLPATATLPLMNGHRLVASSTKETNPDFPFIPDLAIERVEIRNGAPAREIIAMWDQWDIAPTQQAAFYCGTGWRASEAFFYAWLTIRSGSFWPAALAHGAVAFAAGTASIAITARQTTPMPM